MADDKISRPFHTNVSILRSSTTYEETFGLTEITAEAYRHRADADVRVAEAAHAVPARQETARTAMVAGAVFALTIIGALIAPPDKVTTIITTGLVVLGGAWGVVETAKRLRKPPAT